MATGGTDPLTELCEDVLSCEICNEDFNWDTHTPRILSCYHCFCEKCLNQLTKDGSLQCPKCRTEIPVTGKFPVETTRMALMDKKRALQSQKGVPCEGCIEGAKATSRCQDCEEFLCEFCSTAHRRIKSSRKHTLVPFDEVVKNVDKLLQKSEKCERHSDRKLEMVCVTCSAAVCTTCVLTLHQDGHKIVEVDAVLDTKKKEMLALCEKLEEMQQSFQAKAEESEASMEAVEANLKEAVHKVECVFGEIISSATERQNEIIGDLRARAKSDRLLLGEQSTSFRSLQAASHTAAQYGRRCVALSLVSQMFSHTTHLSKTIQELSEKTTAEVKPAPTYKVMADTMAELKALIKEIEIGSSGLLSDVVSMPSIQLDPSRGAPDCWVGEDKCSLSNQPSTHSHSQPQSQRLVSGFAIGTEPVPGSSSYWQVRCRVEPNPEIKEDDLCALGVATQRVVEAISGNGEAPDTGDGSVLWGICIENNIIMIKIDYLDREDSICLSALAPTSPHSSVDVTVGLLLDIATSRAYLIDVKNTRLVASYDIDLSSTMWPFVAVLTQEKCGAKVEVEVQSGRQIMMPSKLVRLLKILLKEEESKKRKKKERITNEEEGGGGGGAK